MANTHTHASFSKSQKNEETSWHRTLPSGGGRDGGGSHRSSSWGGGDLRRHGAEPVSECNHVVGSAYSYLLPEVEATTIMLLWVPKRSKVQALCAISSRQSDCFYLPCCCPKLLEAMPSYEMKVGICQLNISITK